LLKKKTSPLIVKFILKNIFKKVLKDLVTLENFTIFNKFI